MPQQRKRAAILTGSLLTKATGHHDRFYYAGSLWHRLPQTRKQGRVQSSPLNRSKRADCDENKLRLVRAPGESYSDVILRLASDAKP